ncbi:MAG: efflux RND transporter periplasmic adaptor subunit [Clostridia bacterium]|nr:efflux RND transporter periplasmic adaptor subunit [Clostridia bacterium]
MGIFKKKNTNDNNDSIRLKKSSKKKWIVIISVVLIVLICIFAFKGCGKKEVSKVVSSVAKVTRGDVAVTLSGSGTIEANEQYNITSLVKGDVIADYFEEGDIVEKDAPLYSIDTSDMENTIRKSKDSLTKAQRDYDKNIENQQKLTVTAPISGVITKSYIYKNDELSNNAQMVEITDNDTMILKIDFNASDRASLYVGALADVYIDSSSTILPGTIKRISSGSVVNSKGASVIKVDISVKNPGTLTVSDTATAISCGVACNTSGTFSYNEVKTVKAEVQGTVEALNFDEGDRIQKGDVIAVLESDNLEDSLFNSNMSLSDAKENLDNLYDTLEDYTIKSPIGGTVIYKETKAGDKLDNSNNSTVMAIVADMSIIKFDIAVDELDISKIALGQEVTVTADALDGKIFSGYIDYISVVGSTANGVTTYPVTVIVNDPEGLIPGMNVEAEIVVQSSKDTLMIPTTALNRGNTVWVKEGSESAKNGKKVEANTSRPGAQQQKTEANDTHKGYVQIQVEVGMSNDSFVEIISGLSEGDEVLITTVAASNFMTQMMQGGMPGGGMPQGGMPQGGNMGGNRGSNMGGNRAGGGMR